MDTNQYHIDGDPTSARELIDAASLLDRRFAASSLKLTSEAARILREEGYTVGNAPVADDVEPQS